MKNSLIGGESNARLTVKYEITAEDLERVIEDVVVRTTEVLLAKFENERSPKFVTRKEAIERFEKNNDDEN